MSEKPEHFWMIYGVGQRSPTVCHDNEQTAIREAYRLARENPGIEFYVLESIARAVKSDVVFERVEKPDEIPF